MVVAKLRSPFFASARRLRQLAAKLPPDSFNDCKNDRPLPTELDSFDGITDWCGNATAVGGKAVEALSSAPEVVGRNGRSGRAGARAGRNGLRERAAGGGDGLVRGVKLSFTRKYMVADALQRL